MKIDFNIVLRDMDGEILVAENGKEATLKGAAINALLGVFQDESTLSGEDKLKRWEIAVKVKESDLTTEFTIEELVVIKKMIGKAYAPIIVGQAWKLLECN